jgi:tetratricopeptide (TPR) repeat protein
MSGDALLQAQAYYNAGNARRAWEVGLRGLAERPDDVGLLRLVGACSLDLDLDDAADYLRRAVELAPDDADAWHDLGVALVHEGETAEAAEAFRRVVTLRPDDATALVDLGHTLYALGRRDDAIDCLSRAAELERGNLSTLRSLVEMYREAGRAEAALAAAGQILARQPEDVRALVESADLNLALGNLDEAVSAYRRLRSVDNELHHAVYAYHGLIEAEMKREQWRRALDLAVDATRVDRDDLTTQLLAFVVARVFGESDRPVPSRAGLDAALAAERAEHRRLHARALVAR